jgi:hypothetical protein
VTLCKTYDEMNINQENEIILNTVKEDEEKEDFLNTRKSNDE